MLNKETFQKHAMALYDFCEYPAVRYKILFSLLDTPYEDESLSRLRGEFLHSDIVEEMYQTQGENGGWGRLRSKDYSVKAKIPTSEVGIERCLYIGLTLEDRDILFMAREYLLSLLDGTAPEGMFEKNQRANPWQTALVCSLLEDISPYSEESDDTYNRWLYIAQRAYGSGEYSYEEDQAAQHEVFSTREKQLVPMQSGLLLKRRDRISPELEAAMLRHLGGAANEKGYFWACTPGKLPESFGDRKTRRWFKTFNYINQFRGSGLYLELPEEIYGKSGAARFSKQQLLNPGCFLGKFHCMQIITYFNFCDLHRNTFPGGNPLPIVNFLKKFTFDLINVTFAIRVQGAEKQFCTSVFTGKRSFPLRGIRIPADGKGKGYYFPGSFRGVNGLQGFCFTLSAGLLGL